MHSHRHHHHHEHSPRRRGGPFGGGALGAGFGDAALGGGGPRMRGARVLGSGDLHLIILQLLNEKPRHGYELMKAIEEHSSGAYAPSPGMVYPALTYLEETGFAESSSEGAKKLYRMTAAGTEYLAAHRDAAQSVWAHLGNLGRHVARVRRHFADEEELANHFGSEPGTEPGMGARAMRDEFRSLREELRAAVLEKIDAPQEEKRRILDVLRRAIAEIRGQV